MALTQSQYDFVERAATLNPDYLVTAHEMCWAVLVEFKAQRIGGRWACEAIYAIDGNADILQSDGR